MVAEWAGHSVEVLLRIYAKCLDGGDALIRQRVQAALGYADPTNGEERITEPDASPGCGSPAHSHSFAATCCCFLRPVGASRASRMRCCPRTITGRA
jgi:hypothetical protein